MSANRVLQQVSSDNYHEKTEIEQNKYGAIAIVITVLFFHLLIIGATIDQATFISLLPYVLGAIGGIIFIFSTMKFGELTKNRIRLFIIFSIFSIVIYYLIVRSIGGEYYLGFFGFGISFPLLLLKIAPTGITYDLVKSGEDYILTKVTKYLFFSTKMRIQFSEQSTFRLYVESNGVDSLVKVSNYYHTLVIEDIKSNPRPIEFVPTGLRGLLLLSKLVEVVPPGSVINTNRLDRPTGGLLSHNEPIVKAVSDYSPDLIGNKKNLSVEEIENLYSRDSSKIVVPSEKTLILQFGWGLISFFLIGGVATLFSLFAYFSIVDNGLSLFLSFSISGLLLLGLLIFMSIRFILHPILFWFGDLEFQEKNELIYISHHKFGLRGYTYKIPLNLNPQIQFENGQVSIICKDNYSIFYELPLFTNR